MEKLSEEEFKKICKYLSKNPPAWLSKRFFMCGGVSPLTEEKIIECEKDWKEEKNLTRI